MIRSTRFVPSERALTATPTDSPLIPYRLRKHRRRWTTWVTPLVAAGTALGWQAMLAADDDRHWMLIARDSSYSISLDTMRISRVYDRVYDVWYRTDHREMRSYKDSAFDYETVHVEIACRPTSFKVVSTTLSLCGKGTGWRDVHRRRFSLARSMIVEIPRSPVGALQWEPSSGSSPVGGLPMFRRTSDAR